MSVPVPAIPAPPPLPGDIARQLVTANQHWAPLRRAGRWAAFDAFSMAVLGALTLIGGWQSLTGILIGAALIAAAVVEFRAVRQLRRLQGHSLKTLAYNQFALAGALIVYSLWSIWLISQGKGMMAAVTDELQQLGSYSSDARDVLPEVLYGIYAILIAVAVLYQGGSGLYFLTRRRRLQDYVQNTPPWIQQMQREQGRLMG